MSRLHMLVLTAALVGCGGASKPVHKPGDEYLNEIKIEGNKTIGDEELKKGLALTRSMDAGRGIDEYQLSLDTSRISGAYQRKGFFAVDVKSHAVRQGDAVTLVFTVTEGPRSTATVEILGLPPEINGQEARALVKLEDGGPFDYAAFDDAKQPLLALVEDAGYAHAQLDAAVLADRGTGKAVLRYAVDAGPRVKFGDVTVSGVSDQLAEAARNRVTFSPGDWYSARELAATQQAIYGVQRFQSVHMDVDRTSTQPVMPVKIVLVEAKRWELKAGGGAGLDVLTWQLRLRGVVTYALAPLTTVGFELKPSLTGLRDTCGWSGLNPIDCEYEPRVRAILSLTQQDLFYRDVKGEAEGGLDYLTFEAYTTKGARARLGLSSPLFGSHLDLHAGWQFGYYDFSHINLLLDDALQAELGIDQNERLGTFTQSVALDFRDHPIEPTLGAYAELRIAEGGAFAGGAYDYVQVAPDVRFYLPFDRTAKPGKAPEARAVLAARGRFGVIAGDVPPTERYYSGGSSHRGFSERRLSPTIYGTDADGNPVSVVIGGAALVETGAELRVPFHLFGAKFGGVAFVDGGDVTKQPSDLDVTHLHWAVGIGLRPWYFPVGPIRIELAYRLNRSGAGEPSAGQRFNWVIGVGEAF